MRILQYDILKGGAIILVVYGHCLQYVFGSSLGNPVFDFLCAFHMPLFMIISGILLYPKLSAGWSFLLKRAVLLVPSVTFGLAFMLMQVANGHIPTISQIFRLPLSYWFLSSLYVSSALYYLLHKACKNVLVLVLLLTLLSLVLPLEKYDRFMIPFVGVGLIIARYDLIPHLMQVKKRIIIPLIVGGGSDLHSVLECGHDDISVFISPFN